MLSLPSFMRRIIAASLLLLLVVLAAASADDTAPGAVEVKRFKAGKGSPVNKHSIYNTLMTLYIKEADGNLKKAGVSTRKSDGAPGGEDTYYEMEPGGDEMIEGLKIGILQMNEGDRSMIHVPSHLAYGDKEIGSPGGSFYIPPRANVVFDIEIRGKKGYPESPDL